MKNFIIGSLMANYIIQYFPESIGVFYGNLTSKRFRIDHLADTSEDSKLVYRHKNRREYFLPLFSDAAERRVWLNAESKILASTFVQIRLYRLKLKWPSKKFMIIFEAQNRLFKLL